MLWGALFVVVGCAEGPASYDEGRAELCGGICAGYQRCSLADSGCTERCLARYQPQGIRGDVLVRVGDCLREESCETLASEQPLRACYERVSETEPLRPALVHYCESASLAYFECGTWWETERCARSMSVWEDDRLGRAEQCHARGCDELVSCERSVFEG